MHGIPSRALGLCLAALLAGCTEGPTSTAASTSVATPSAVTTLPPFPPSPAPSQDAIAALDGILGAFVLQPALTGLDPLAIEGDPIPMMLNIEASRIMSDVEAISMPRGVEEPDALIHAADHLVSALESSGFEPEIMPERRSGGAPLATVRIEGTVCPERVVVAAAHYDAPEGSPGADANASGAAALVEIARAMRSDPQPASIELALLPLGATEPLSAEEYLRSFGEDLPVAFLSLDRIGVTAPGDDELYGAPPEFLLMTADKSSEYLARVLAVASGRFMPWFWAWSSVISPELVPESLGSDHAPFWEAGVQAVFVSDTGTRRDPRIGTAEDAPEILDPDFLGNSARAVIAGLVGLATIDVARDGEPDVCTRDF